ncbi:MAG: UDP-N-acetylmuramate dehydrogenase [Candidatus Mycalebacterium zealandia]|nr:MAG: UDP-N-acetylmuramate dehydrogenase [Candidatus Mycalebacterium zealandia]
MKRLAAELEKLGCETVSDFRMSSYTAMRVGGRARIVAYPQTRAALCGTLAFLRTESVPFEVLGGGTNTIVKDSGFDGAIVSTSRLKGFEIKPGFSVTADCGAPLSAVMNATTRAGLSGLEFAAGIPGTVGGAVFMNAGACGGETAEVVESVVVWQDGKEHEIGAGELSPAYRHGGLPPDSVLLGARLRLVVGDALKSRAAIKKSLEHRKQTQPVSEANTGSIFKNPRSVAAGRLLEEIGMKLFSVGAAEFSGVHANFIVNKGGAKTSDVLKLIKIARVKALEKKGLYLETEVCVI